MSEQKPETGNMLNESIHAALKGDDSAYSRFLEITSRILRAYLIRTIPQTGSISKDIVEDLVQDVLLTVHRKRATYDPSQPVLPWLMAIAKHRWIDHARMMSVRPEVLDWDPKVLNEMKEMVGITAEDQLIDHESVQEWMAPLNEAQKKLIQLAKLDELPLEEVGRRLGLSLSNVKVGIHRAVLKMQKTSGFKKREQ